MSMVEIDNRQLLLEWVTKHARQNVDGSLQYDTPILEQRIISSLQVMELILFIEKTTGKPVTAAQLSPKAFRSIETIHQTFFAGEGHE
jgi:hypothetical protein